MHFFKALTLLATVSFAAVAVALPAAGTNAISVKPDTSLCGELVRIFSGVDALISDIEDQLTNISLGLYELDTYVNQTVTLLSIYGDNSINCTLTDTLSIVDYAEDTVEKLELLDASQGGPEMDEIIEEFNEFIDDADELDSLLNSLQPFLNDPY